MKALFIVSFVLFVVIGANAQNHKATKAEADYYNQAELIHNALPQKFLGGSMDDFGVEPWGIEVGSNMNDCKSMDCYMLYIGATYGPPMNDPGYVALKKQRDAIKGTDDASLNKQTQLDYQMNNKYNIVLKAFANFASGEYFLYCGPGGYQKLTPPAGWDGWYMGSIDKCLIADDVQQGDMSFIFMGAPPTIKESKGRTVIKGFPNFPISQADVSQFKVKNVVFYIQGSKELVAEFMKSVNTEALRSMIQK